MFRIKIFVTLVHMIFAIIEDLMVVLYYNTFTRSHDELFVDWCLRGSHDDFFVDGCLRGSSDFHVIDGCLPESRDCDFVDG